MNKPKVLLIQEFIPHYRMPIYNGLAEIVDLTVVYSAGTLPDGAKFNAMYIPKTTVPINLLIKKTSRTFSHQNYYMLAKNYDVVICIAYYNWIDMTMMEFLPHKYKFIYWGIGVAASYGVPYDSSPSFARETCRHAKNVDAMLFYSDYPVKKYIKMGVNPEKLFVANNTVEVADIQYTSENRDTILFIGTLYKDKRVDVLIDSYYKAYLQNKEIPKMIIIGEGEERTELEAMVAKYNLEAYVRFTGKITDDNILKEYFMKALICVSPNQAGLSVLKSMGYGVPYVTSKDAITGGEIFNIHNGTDGVLLNDFSDLDKILIDITNNKSKYLKMGEAAYDYYQNERKPEKMVEGFVNAINYVLNK